MPMAMKPSNQPHFGAGRKPAHEKPAEGKHSARLPPANIRAPIPPHLELARPEYAPRAPEIIRERYREAASIEGALRTGLEDGNGNRIRALNELKHLLSFERKLPFEEKARGQPGELPLDFGEASLARELKEAYTHMAHQFSVETMPQLAHSAMMQAIELVKHAEAQKALQKKPA